VRRRISLPAAVAAALLAVGALPPTGCRERPPECQRLRQCCDLAKQQGLEIDLVRVQCTRPDDNDAVLCSRRLDEVKAAFPTISDLPECRLAPQ
jgi:hypothetical protein